MTTSATLRGDLGSRSRRPRTPQGALRVLIGRQSQRPSRRQTLGGRRLDEDRLSSAPARPRCPRGPARSSRCRTAARPRAGRARGRSGRSTRPAEARPDRTARSGVLGVERAHGLQRGPRRGEATISSPAATTTAARRFRGAAARGPASGGASRVRSGGRETIQPAHSSAGTALPGTTHDQSSAECAPKTRTVDGERRDPDPLRVPRQLGLASGDPEDADRRGEERERSPAARG